MKARASRKRTKSFGVCIRNRGYAASLETRKIYELLSDPKAAARGFVRVIDESGEDYLYPEAWFARIKLPSKANRLFVHSA